LYLTKHSTKPTKTGGELRGSRGISISCSICDIRRGIVKRHVHHLV
jgi:hypothetical protein